MTFALKEIAKYCIAEMRKKTEIYLTEEDEATHREATQCVLCNEDFTASNWKVRDHDHRTGQYRGACHTNCNIYYFQHRYLPIFVHNLRGYDSHIILKEAFEIVEKRTHSRNTTTNG